jgi:hypothetical protein
MCLLQPSTGALLFQSKNGTLTTIRIGTAGQEDRFNIYINPTTSYPYLYVGLPISGVSGPRVGFWDGATNPGTLQFGNLHAVGQVCSGNMCLYQPSSNLLSVQSQDQSKTVAQFSLLPPANGGTGLTVFLNGDGKDPLFYVQSDQTAGFYCGSCGGRGSIGTLYAQHFTT